MVGVFILFASMFASFVVGTIVGINNKASVTEAITVLKSAEQTAQATLAEITAHKAS